MKKLHKIAFVDPHAELARAYQKRLQMDGFEVYVFKNGQEAIAAILDLPFDAVITEHELPDIGFMDLYDILRNKKMAYSLPIIVLTKEYSNSFMKYQDFDIDNFFVKSDTHPNEIIDRLRYLLRT